MKQIILGVMLAGTAWALGFGIAFLLKDKEQICSVYAGDYYTFPGAVKNHMDNGGSVVGDTEYHNDGTLSVRLCI